MRSSRTTGLASKSCSTRIQAWPRALSGKQTSPVKNLSLDLRRRYGCIGRAGYRVEIVRLLLAAGADPNAATNHRRSTRCIMRGRFITVPVGMRSGKCKPFRAFWTTAPYQAQDKNGATALHRAVRTRCAAAVKFLLQAGADPTIKNKPGSTPFHLAVQNTGRGDQARRKL